MNESEDGFSTLEDCSCGGSSDSLKYYNLWYCKLTPLSKEGGKHSGGPYVMLSWASREFVAQSFKANAGGYIWDTVQGDGDCSNAIELLGHAY